MKKSHRRLIFIAATVFGLFVIFGHAAREITTEERLSEASSNWIYFEGMKLNVSLHFEKSKFKLRFARFSSLRSAIFAISNCFPGNSFRNFYSRTA